MRFEVLGPGSAGTLIVRDHDTGKVDYWIRGFTYKPWVCAETLTVIPASYPGHKHWAWRIEEPEGNTDAMLRVKAEVFDGYAAQGS